MRRDFESALALAFVIGMGLGVVVMDFARDRRLLEAERVAERAIAVAETYALACGVPEDVVIAEVRR